MATNFKIAALISFVGLTAIYGMCNKRIDCSQTIYSFQANFSTYPDLDSSRLNDTIWLELQTSTQLKDAMANKNVDYSGAQNFGTAINYLEIIGGNLSDPGVTPAANSFENILRKGSQVQSIKPVIGNYIGKTIS